MNEILKELVTFLKNRLGVQSLAVLLLCAGAIYIWYQHLHQKLLKEQLEHEKAKRTDFIEAVRDLMPEQPEKATNSTDPAATVLVVDDEAAMRMIVSKMLRRKDLEIHVETASDGEEALAKIRNERPRILITDIVMPRLGGIELLKALRTEGLELPTLVISGYSSDDVFPKLAKEAGLGSRPDLLFLQKPFNVEDFQQMLNQLKALTTQRAANRDRNAPRGASLPHH